MPQASAHTNPWAIGETVFGLPFVAGVALRWLVPLALPGGAVRFVALLLGIVLVVVGVALIVLARREMARHSQPTDPGHPTTRIVSGGVFAFSRNPMYLGAVCLLLGLALAFYLPWAALSLVPAMIICHYVLIAPEERYLAATFGDAWTRYAARVRRWVGRRG